LEKWCVFSPALNLRERKNLSPLKFGGFPGVFALALDLSQMESSLKKLGHVINPLTPEVLYPKCIF